MLQKGLLFYVKYFQFAAALQEQDKIQLVIKDVSFKGPQTLKQFSIEQHTILEQLKHYRINVAVNFKRIFSYHLTNTYLPTLRWVKNLRKIASPKLGKNYPA